MEMNQSSSYSQIIQQKNKDTSASYQSAYPTGMSTWHAKKNPTTPGCQLETIKKIENRNLEF